MFPNPTNNNLQPREPTNDPFSSPSPQHTQNFDLLTELNHPMFSQPDDPIINYFKDIVHNSFKLEKGKVGLLKLFSDLIFQGKSPAELKAIYEQKGLSFDAVCGKIIPKNVAFYMCLDCDKLRKNDSALVCCLCKECFLHSKHIGHRVLMSANSDDSSSACDCGDSSIFDSNGFCSVHSRNSVDLESITQAIGIDIVNNLNKTMGAAFYGVFSLVELLPEIKKKSLIEKTLPTNLLHDLCKVIDFCLGTITYFCDTLISKVNSAFIPVIANFIQSELPQGYKTLAHNCNEYKKPIYTSTTCECTCTIGELITKNIAAFLPTFHESFIQFCNTLSKYENFKEYMALTFMKTIYFIFYQDDPAYRVKEPTSMFAKANVHFYTSVDLCEKTVRDPVIQNLFDLISDIIQHYAEPGPHFPILIWEQKSLIKCLLRPQSEVCAILLKEKKITLILLDYLVKHLYLHAYPGPIFPEMTLIDVNLFFITRNLAVYGMLEALFKRTIVQLGEISPTDRESLYEEIVSKWKVLFEDYLSKQKYREISFLPALERVANCLIRGPDLSITKERVRRFLERMSPNNVSQNAEQLLQGTILQMGSLRKIYLIDAKTRNDVGFMYFNEEYCLFDDDTTSIQMLLPWLSSETVLPFIINNWFQYSEDIKDYVLNDKTEKKLGKENIDSLEDFLGLLVYFMIDEISSTKLKLSKDPRDYNQAIDFSEDLARVVKKLLISLLATHYWVDFNIVKQYMKTMLWENNIENVLPDLTLKEEKTSRIRLKEEYYSEVDLFLFAHKRIVQKDVLNIIQGDGDKRNKVDTVSGVYYTDLPYYCYEIQKLLFESPLPSFLARVISTFSAEVELLLRPVLRLILMHLQSIQYFQKKGVDTTLLVKQAESYFTKDFRLGLEKIKDNLGHSDCHIAVKKLEGLLKDTIKTQDSETEMKIENENSKENEALKKKQLAEQKMKALKEEFQKKQKSFMATLDQKGLSEQMTEEVKENNNTTQCNVCLQNINTETELYGSPYFINFVNPGGSLDPETQAEDVFPVLHSCGHHFHQKCFLSWALKTLSPQGANQILLNVSETYCPFCSTLANVFCPLNGKLKDSEDDMEGSTENDDYEKLQIKPTNRMLNKLGMLKLFFVSRDHSIFAANDPKELETIIAEGIVSLRNMYWLYMQSLDFHSFEHFSKKFKLYSEFLLSVKRQALIDKQAFEKIRISNLEDSSTLEDAILMDLLYEILFAKEYAREKAIENLYSYILQKLKEGLKALDPSKEIDKEQVSMQIMSILANPEEKGVLLNELAPVLRRALVLFAFIECHYGNQETSSQILDGLKEGSSEIVLGLCTTYLKIGELPELLEHTVKMYEEQKELIKADKKLEKPAENQCKYIAVPKLEIYQIELPVTYQGFVDKYFNHICSYCRDLPAHGEKLICLICGQVVCRTRCAKKISNTQLGTANIHCLEHCGIGFYVEIYMHGLVFINFPKNIIARKRILYADESGQNVSSLIINVFDKKLDAIDFNKFTLNRETMKYIQAVVREFSIPLELFTNAKSTSHNSRIIVDGVL